MSNFVAKALHKLLHCFPPTRAQHAPYSWTTPMHGQTRQFATPPDTSTFLDPNGMKYVQKVVSSFFVLC